MTTNGTETIAHSFSHSAATRTLTPLFVGLMGPSGTGKTYSALRLATGMQRVTGGKVFVIDTESGRSLHYAPKPGQKANPKMGTFEFQYVPFDAPYDPLRYLAAIEYCAANGAKIVIVDSMSHEHEGVGGVLEMHEREVKRLAQEWKTTEDKVKMTAWGKPKAARRKLINGLLHMSVTCIFCFRAKKKLKIVKGKDPEELGFVPIAGDEFIYEMMLKCVLLPGACGVPSWLSEFEGERENMKLPGQFAHLFDDPQPLSEEIGEALANWSAGNDQAPSDEECAKLIAKIQAAENSQAALRLAQKAGSRPWTDEQRKLIRAAIDGKKGAAS